MVADGILGICTVAADRMWMLIGANAPTHLVPGPFQPHEHKQGKRRILWIESIGFTIIIVLAWLTEVTRLPHVLFDEPFVPNWHRAILRTVVVVLVWIWVFVETRRLLDRVRRLEEFLVVCAWCRKIGDRGEWVSMEKYFGSNFDTRTSHAMCPECSDKFVATMPQKKE